MAELLVRALDNLGGPETGLYKRGMPVVVMPDGHVWGAAEGLPGFWIIKLPTVTVAQALKYIETWREGGDPRGAIVKRREWVIDITQLPAAAQTTLTETGILTIPGDLTWNQARQAFRNMRTGTTE